MTYGTAAHQQHDNFKWLDGSCSVPVDGYLCRYTYKGMCPAVWSEGGGNALYSTPFSLLSSLLTHVPFGSVATVPCPGGSKEEQSVLCMLREDGTVGWSRETPLCSDTAEKSWCDRDNGGCEHFCQEAGEHFYCECSDGFQLGDDGQTCVAADPCHSAPCEFECLPLSDGYRCACPEGYMLSPDERGCLDVDECLQSPCEQLCVNAPGTFECRCREGYRPVEEGECEDVDECMEDPCEHACENTPGSHVCHCHLGFSPPTEEPSHCQDTDECQIPGTCQQMCVNYEGGFECYCEVGYELLSDHFSCRKIGEGEDSFPAATPSYPWVTRHPESLDWLTDPPRVENDVIWVTSAPREEPLESTPSPSPSSEPTSTPTPTPTSDWYEEEDDETTTSSSVLPTSTISGGAWNWLWFSPASQDQVLTKPQEPITDQHVPASNYDDTDDNEEEGDIDNGKVTSLPEQDQGQGENQDQEPPQEDESSQKQGGGNWLLVGLLVPLCIFIIIMVALGIVYCTRCAVTPRNKTATNCYHWISRAHDKQGAPNPSKGMQSHV
uniref:CD248 molecule, endosialin a n=1 Tax=Hucho hucho TaxID=62062 RepID=A0A4W5MF19_9TELE